MDIARSNLSNAWRIHSWPKSKLPENTFIAAKLRNISIKCLTPFHIFGHWTADVKKKSTIQQIHIIKKSCDTIQKKWGICGLILPNSLSIPPNSSSNLPNKVSFHSLYTSKLPKQTKSHPRCCLSASVHASKHKWESAYNQFKITILSQQHHT